MHKFKISPAKGDQFVAKFVYNSETLIWSENYASKASAKSCIDSIKTHAPKAAIADLTKSEEAKGYRFELVGSKDGQTFVRFVAANGQTLMRSETYKAKSSAMNCVESVRTRSAEAPVEDETAA